jgi:hypothetical protein
MKKLSSASQRIITRVSRNSNFTTGVRSDDPGQPEGEELTDPYSIMRI